MLEDATTFNLMKYGLFHFKPLRRGCQMQIIHQTQKCTYCSAESYLACFRDMSHTLYNAAHMMHVLILEDVFFLHAKLSFL